HSGARRPRPRTRTLHGSLRPRRPGRGRARLLREARARMDERLMDAARAKAPASKPAAGELLADVHAGVATVTLNRPDALNALSFGMLEELAELLARWEKDEYVRLVVLRGAGDKAFCAGGDVRALYAAFTA